MTDIPIRKEALDLAAFLIGTPRQFLVYQGSVFCVRAHPDDLEGKRPELNPCSGCPHFEVGCELRDQAPLQVPIRNPDGTLSGIEPHSRRGIGLEERPFLVLRFKSDHSHATLPRELWDNPHSDLATDEANIHFALTDPNTATFYNFKGQFRFYGTSAEFHESRYAEYFTLVDDYHPTHLPTSLDFSAIEPRVSTLASREPQWIKIFEGTPKIISREITLTTDPGKTPYILTRDGRTYCHLNDEMDKVQYDGDEGQCFKCALKTHCSVIQDHYKSVADDWHSLNATGLYGKEFTEASKQTRKFLRGIAKIVGLALCYGGSAWTVSGNMQSTREEAQKRIDSFFKTLVDLKQYMDNARATVLKTGVVANLFGRLRDVHRYSHSQAVTPDGKPDWKQRNRDRGYAERTALNHPIQSTAAEILKLAMIRLTELIQTKRWSPIFGQPAMPSKITLRPGLYNDLHFALLSTVHDELLNICLGDKLEEIVPQVYTTMQLSDVMDVLKAGFTLELDCEYDSTRSWTAKTKLHTARIYLLNRLANPPSQTELPNLAVLDWNDCDKVFLDALQTAPEPLDAADTIQIGILVDNKQLWTSRVRKFSRQWLPSVWNRKIRFALMHA